MTYISVAGPFRWPNVLAAALLSIAVAACGSDSSGGDAGGGGTGGTPGPTGCLSRNFPGEPDALVFPQPPLQSPPGSLVEFSVFVDSETRLVRATFMGAYRLDPTASPQSPSETQMIPTAGNETVDFAIQVNGSGRYYVDFELCGTADCSELRVVYTLDRALAGEIPPGGDALAPLNNPYERILYLDDVESPPSSRTCDKPRSVAMQN